MQKSSRPSRMPSRNWRSGFPFRLNRVRLNAMISTGARLADALFFSLRTEWKRARSASDTA
jgi:hypothetical protein